MTKWTSGLVVLCACLLASTSLSAHHSLAGVYALGKEAKITGAFKAFRLINPHSALKVDVKGVVTWKVPANFANEETSVIISIRDIAGKEAFHSFKLVKSNLPEQSE